MFNENMFLVFATPILTNQISDNIVFLIVKHIFTPVNLGLLVINHSLFSHNTVCLCLKVTRDMQTIVHIDKFSLTTVNYSLC